MQEYTVKQNDILGRIAKQFGVSVADIMAANRNIKDPDQIFVDQKIKIPVASGGSGGGRGAKQKPVKNAGSKGSEPIPITKEEYANHYLEQATLTAMANGEYKSKITAAVQNPKVIHASYIAPIEKELEKKENFLNSLEGPVLERYKKELSAIIDGIDEAERFFTKDPKDHIQDFKYIDGITERDLFGVDLEHQSMLEIGVAYGVNFLPKSIPSTEHDEGAAPSKRFMMAMLRKSEQIRKKLKLGDKPRAYHKTFTDKKSKYFDPNFSRAWNKAAQDFISSPGIKEGNIKQSITEFFNKNKTQTAEEFFEIDKMGSKGAQGLIVKMLDVMTPDVNIKYKGQGQEQADAVGYVQDYIKSSFLGMIDSDPNRGDNENADFAKHMDSESWGENINFDTLIQAAKELYEHAGNFFDETQSGSETGSQQETVVTLGVNTIPVLLLFHCLKYLGSSLFKMRKRYNKKRGQPMKENKIIQEYILKNTPSPPKDVSVIEIIADEVNETLNNLPEVQLASEILSEDELKKLFAPLAKQIVMSVHGQIGEKIKGMTVEQALLPQETLINLIDQAGLDNLSDEDQKKLLKLLLNADPDNLEPVDDLEPDDIPDGTGEEEEDES